jgi:hypothetical protein
MFIECKLMRVGSWREESMSPSGIKLCIVCLGGVPIVVILVAEENHCKLKRGEERVETLLQSELLYTL